MNVVVIGSGGREHALSFKIAQSSKLEKLYIIPGNPGTKNLGENIDIKISDFDAIINFCKENEIDLVIVGPEQPLVDGLADELKMNNINVFGPSAEAALIEGDKAFAKNFMQKYSIPTASFNVFEKSEKQKALEFIEEIGYPVVIKAYGLAAGKGVLICADKNEAEEGLKICFDDGVFGEAGNKVVIEEFLQGEEASVFAITDGEKYFILPPSQDHKRIFDGDKGKNTGGMGAYAPAPVVTPDILERIENEIVIPTLKGMIKENKKYVGCLYCGLMITSDGPKVIEYNCRFGDPETQVVLPIIEGDLLELLHSAAIGELNVSSVNYRSGTAVCVIAASDGYPGKYKKGFKITGLNSIHDNDILVFHAGTKEENGKIVTNGGRVLGVTSFIREDDINLAKTKSYNALNKINFNGIYFRKDISNKALK